MNAAVPQVTPHPPGAPPGPPPGPSATPPNTPGAPGGAHYGGLRRFFAWAVDEVIIGIIWLFGGWVIGLYVGLTVGLIIGGASGLNLKQATELEYTLGLLAAVCMYFVCRGVYYPVCESSEMQATPGKRLFGLKVTDLEGHRLLFRHAFGRFAAGFVSWCVFPLLAAGHLAAVFTDRKQTLHDIIARTLVLQGAADAALHDAPAQGGVYYGGFWLRAAACLLDSVFVMVVMSPVQLAVTLGLIYSNPDAVAAATAVNFVILAPTLLLLLFVALYFIIFPCTKWQATPGKRIVGLKITDAEGNKISFGRSLGRYLASIVSTVIVFIGYIMIGFTDRKRGLHDMMAGTLVVKR